MCLLHRCYILLPVRVCVWLSHLTTVGPEVCKRENLCKCPGNLQIPIMPQFNENLIKHGGGVGPLDAVIPA